MRKALSFFAAWCVLAAIAFITVAPIDWRPDTIITVDLDRALAFLLLGGLFTTAYPRRWKLILTGMIAVAFGLELMQLMQDSRHARLSDALVKTSGGLWGVSIALAARQLWFRLEASRTRKASMAGMQEFRLASSSIRSLYFNPQDGSLRLRLADGEERLFAGVAEGDIVAMLNSHAPEQYFLDRIENRYERHAA